MRRARPSSDSGAVYNVATVPGHCGDPNRLSFEFGNCARNYLPSIQACFGRFVRLDDGEHCLISQAPTVAIRDEFGSSAGVFSLPAQREQPLHDGVRSAALDGTRSLDEARARLPLDRARTPEERASMSNTAMLGQLALASTAELTAAISSRGFQRCLVQAPQGQRRRERCQRYAGRTLTDRVVESEIRNRLRAMFDSMTTLAFQCVAGSAPRCEAQRSGATEIQVFIEGAAGDRRISKIVSIDHMIGE